jgi:uncharacterized protein YecE (DUF72 family)
VTDLRVGTAGWSVPADVGDRFPAEGTSLERYAALFSCAEINSTFHRSHRASTYERWAGSVPADFRFSAKLPKTITHQRKLAGCEDLLDLFVSEVSPLAGKLAIILVQLPPSLAFDLPLASGFFDALRQRTDVPLVCEPRHASWFEPDADALLTDAKIARVAADPVKVEPAAAPGGWRGLSYYRLHGSPVPYRSSYDDGRLETYAHAIAEDRRAGKPVWCIFDNTASSAAGGDALKLAGLV